MIRKLTMEVTEEMYPWLLGFIATMEHALGVPIKATMKEVLENREVSTSTDRSTVRYVALGGREALASLGENTIIGLIFAHLVDHGPKTCNEIGQEKPFNKKTIEASLWRLRHQGLITNQEV